MKIKCIHITLVSPALICFRIEWPDGDVFPDLGGDLGLSINLPLTIELEKILGKIPDKNALTMLAKKIASFALRLHVLAGKGDYSKYANADECMEALQAIDASNIKYEGFEDDE